MSHKTVSAKQCLHLRHRFPEQKDQLASGKFFCDSNTLNEPSASRVRQKSESDEASSRLLS